MYPNRRIGYLASEYPAISHTFIFREIQSLRAEGIEVITASIRKPQNLELMTPDEVADSKASRYIKDSPLVRVAGLHASLLIRAPKAYLGMISTTIRLARSHPELRVWKALAYFAEAGILLHWMRAGEVDHVHVHFANPAATVAMIAAGGGTITYSLSVHGPDVFDNVEGNMLREKVSGALFTRCISFYCRSQLLKLIPPERSPKLPIVRCGIDVDRFEARPDPGNALPEILCVGRLVAVKGHHVLLEACGDLKERGVAFHLTFVGDGPERGALEATRAALGLSDVVTFAGAVGQDAVHAHYDRADIFALASFGEGVPVVLMEAMAKEIPCVSTSIAGIPELIEDGKTGFLVPPSDRTILTERLERLLGDPVLRKSMGRAGRKKVQSEYEIRRSGREMAKLFKTAFPGERS